MSISNRFFPLYFFCEATNIDLYHEITVLFFVMTVAVAASAVVVVDHNNSGSFECSGWRNANIKFKHPNWMKLTFTALARDNGIMNLF